MQLLPKKSAMHAGRFDTTHANADKVQYYDRKILMKARGVRKFHAPSTGPSDGGPAPPPPGSSPVCGGQGQAKGGGREEGGGREGAAKCPWQHYAHQYMRDVGQGCRGNAATRVGADPQGSRRGGRRGGGVCVVQVGRGAARPTSMQSKIIEGFRVQCECVRVRALELPARAAAGTQQRQGPLMSRAAAAGPAWVPGQRVRGRRTQSQSVR